jgi:DNA-binding response OmpR family regulator
LARITLSGAGYHVLTADNGVAGLSLARAEHPDAIVLDALLPDEQSVELLQQLRHGRGTEQIPVILITAAVTGPQLAREVRQAHARTLRKPFRALKLVSMVNRALHPRSKLPMAG